jgi:hypothetical protein
MKLIFHMGMPKTGTSSIQRFLKRNPDVLTQAGLLYPLAPKMGDAHTHLCLLHDYENPPNFLATRYGNNPQDRRAAAVGLLDRIEQDIAGAPDTTHTVIMSSEAVFFRPRVAQSAEFMAMIARWFQQVEFVCYVRRPSSYYLSVLQQNLKANHRLVLPNVPPYKNVFDRVLQDFDLVVREFDRRALHGGSIVTDFWAAVLNADPALIKNIPDMNENSSYSATAMQIMRIFRENLPDELNGVRNRQTIAFEGLLHEIDGDVPNWEKPQLLTYIAS